ncbi:MAG: hypothetical protein ACYTHM_14220 [Planctomycetota bacterium]|jgi:hypothetical protein
MEEEKIAITTAASKAKGELLVQLLGTHNIQAVLTLNEKMQVLGEVSAENQPHDVWVSRACAEEALNVIQTSKTQEVAGADMDFEDLITKCPKCLHELG